MKRILLLVLTALLLSGCSSTGEPPPESETPAEKPDFIVAFESDLRFDRIVALNLWGQYDINNDNALYQEIWDTVRFSEWVEIPSATSSDQLLNLNFIAEDGTKLSLTLYGTDTAILFRKDQNDLRYRIPEDTYDRVMDLLQPYLGAESFTESEVLDAIQMTPNHTFRLRILSDSADVIVSETMGAELLAVLDFDTWIFDNAVSLEITSEDVDYRIYGDHDLTVYFYPDLQCAVVTQSAKLCSYRIPAEVSAAMEAVLVRIVSE